MTRTQLIDWTNEYTFNVRYLCLNLPKHQPYTTINGELVRSSTSASASLTAAYNVTSVTDFNRKLSFVEAELDGVLYFLSLLNEIHKENKEVIEELLIEGDKLLSVILNADKIVDDNQNQDPKA